MKRIFSFLVIAAMVSFVGCSEPEPEPIITEDNIAPDTTADTVVEMAEEAANVPYIWIGEDYDEAVEIHAALAQYHELPGDYLEGLEAHVEEQQSYNPTVTAQEVANIMAEIMTENLNLTPGTIMPQDMQEAYTRDNPSPISVHLDNFEGKLHWYVQGQLSFFSQLDTLYVDIKVDATTAEVLGAAFFIGYEDIQMEMQATPIHPAFIEDEEYPEAPIYGSWDTESPEYQTMIDEMIAEFKENLDGSLLAGGASISNIEHRLIADALDDPFYTALPFEVTFDDGRILTIIKAGDSTPYYQYDIFGSPLWKCSFIYGQTIEDLI